jgi:hypothetical protein
MIFIRYRESDQGNIHGAIAVIFDRFDLNLSATHDEELRAHERRAEESK